MQAVNSNQICGKLGLLISLFMLSCASPFSVIEPGVNYMKDIRIKNKQFEARGMIVLPRKPLYTIEYHSPGKVDLFTSRTRDSEISIEKAGGGIKKNKVTINYRPSELELSPGSIVDVGAFEYKRGRHAWGLIDFQDEFTTLQADVICNGKPYKSPGVTVCQSRTGLVQKISFPEEVTVLPDEGCEIGKNKGTEFIFGIRSGLCVYAFVGLEKIHRLTTFGYDKILIRE
jgi:hypothetical protein